MQPIKHSIASFLAPTAPEANNERASSEDAMRSFSIASLIAPTVPQANRQTGQPVIKGYSMASLLASTVPQANNQSVNVQPAVRNTSETNQESNEQFYERMRNNCLAVLANRNYDFLGINWPPGLNQQIFMSQLKAGSQNEEVIKRQKLETEKPVTHAHKCVYCGKEYTDEKQYSRHLRKHTDLRPFQCDICPSTFKNSYDLRKHQESHTARQHQCVACSFRFKTFSELENHMNAYKDLHGTKNPITNRFYCKRCGRSFTRRSSLKYHMQYSKVCREESVGGFPNTMSTGDREPGSI